jgi:hypothetical protein
VGGTFVPDLTALLQPEIPEIDPARSILFDLQRDRAAHFPGGGVVVEDRQDLTVTVSATWRRRSPVR